LNKKLKILLSVLVGIVIFYHVLKFLGILVIYSAPTTSSEPTIKSGSFIVATNLITPKRGDFITYRFNDPMFGEAIWFHRLCGIANDTIQIVDGVLFVNGKNFDANYNLKHAYLLNEEKFASLDESVVGKDYLMFPSDDETAYITFIEDTEAERLQLQDYTFKEAATKPNPQTKEVYQQDWNKDHFGPLIIPEGKIFILGDNRDNAADSRTYGLIDKEAITGVFFWSILF